MNTQSDDPDSYSVGGLDPKDASRLIDALEQAGIDFDAQLRQDPTSVELEGDSPATHITITVDAASEVIVRRIKEDLFGEVR